MNFSGFIIRSLGQHYIYRSHIVIKLHMERDYSTFFYKDTFIRLNVHECFACTYMCTPHACLMSIQPTRWLGLRMVKSHCANAETGTQVLCRATSPPQFSAQPLPIKKRKGRERLGQKMVNDKKAFKQYQQAPKLWHMTKRCIFEMS